MGGSRGPPTGRRGASHQITSAPAPLFERTRRVFVVAMADLTGKPVPTFRVEPVSSNWPGGDDEVLDKRLALPDALLVKGRAFVLHFYNNG